MDTLAWKWRLIESEGYLPGELRNTWAAEVPGGTLIRTVVTAQDGYRERSPDARSHIALSVGVAMCFVPDPEPQTAYAHPSETERTVDADPTPGLSETERVQRALDANPPGTWVRPDGSVAIDQQPRYVLPRSGGGYR